MNSNNFLDFISIWAFYKYDFQDFQMHMQLMATLHSTFIEPNNA